MSLNNAFLDSPIGLIEVTEQDGYISGVTFLDHTDDIHGGVENELLNQAIRQLKEYFIGDRTVFDLPLQQKGTHFQQKVWTKLVDINCGETKSYLDIAQELGDKNLTRAVGSANGKNNIAIVVPCHRVIGHNNTLTGYAGGLWRKDWLLKHEGIVLDSQLKLF